MNIRAKIYGGGNAAEEPLLKAKKPKGAKADTLNSVAVARESRLRVNSRAEDRHRLADERARVIHEGLEHEVQLINLSGGGAMIGATFEPMLWDRIDLRLGHHGTIECAVCWMREGRIGLEFAHETRLDWPSDQVATVLRHVIERTFPHIAFPEREEVETSQPEQPQSSESKGDHRVAPRHPLIWSGLLHHDYQSTNVRIRNISSTGAMLETSENVRVGAEPLLELSDKVSLSATVEWAVGDQVGLRFHSPFDLDLLVEARPSVATTEWTPPAYLSASSNEADDASSNDHWNRLTLTELQRQLDGFLKH
jgi:hypothetical protein